MVMMKIYRMLSMLDLKLSPLLFLLDVDLLMMSLNYSLLGLMDINFRDYGLLPKISLISVIGKIIHLNRIANTSKNISPRLKNSATGSISPQVKSIGSKHSVNRQDAQKSVIYLFYGGLLLFRKLIARLVDGKLHICRW